MHKTFVRSGFKKVFIAIGVAFVCIPLPVFAVTTVQQILITVGGLVKTATPIVFALALLAFFWGLAMYLFGAGNGGSGQSAHAMFGAPSTSGKRDGRAVMIMGVFTLFVMVTIWGLVNVLQATFGVYSGTISPPVITSPY